MINIDVMQDASEIVHYNNPKLLLYIKKGCLSSYPHMKALCHWHEDIELIYIFDGEMNYDINGKKILLKSGDTIVINSKQMHYGYSNHYNDCTFLCILFHPSLLMSQAYTTNSYLKPILENSCIEYILYPYGMPKATEITCLQKEILHLNEVHELGFELALISKLYELWLIIYHSCKEQNLISYESTQPSDLLIQKKMVSYIYQNYSETISLEDIASSGNVSRSKCCLLFKKYLQQSPIEFLNAYRLEVSCNLLKNTKESISAIAFGCGFNHLSYYSKIFCKKYNCTPSEFRNR